jgi:hypothetical protein
MTDKHYVEETEPGQQPKHEVIITDMRHGRSVEEPPSAETSPAVAEPPPPGPAAVEPEVEQEIGHPEEARRVSHDEQAAALEFEQLKMLFGAGLTAYLHSQIGLLLNFAMIALGRAANPATGLVAVDLEKAKLAIDMIEFIAGRIQAELPAEEKAVIAQYVGELKYLYVQATQAGPPPPGAAK